MKSFKAYCEDFTQFDSQVGRKGTGPSVGAASLNGVLQKPSAINTKSIGDNTGATGNNRYLVRNVKTPFDYKIKYENDQYRIYIKYKKDLKYLPLKNTEFADKYSCDYPTRDEAVEALRDLKFRISQVDISKK